MNEKLKPYGYLIDSGYKGLVGNRFILFPTEAEYLEYIREFNEDKAD